MIKLRTLLVGLVGAGTHLGFSLHALSKASFNGEGMAWWQGASSVLGFPLVYIDRVNYGPLHSFLPRGDMFSVLVVANSVLWGVVVALLFAWIIRRQRVRGSGPEREAT